MQLLTKLVLTLSLTGFSYALPAVAVAAIDSNTSSLAVASQKASFLFVLRATTGVITKVKGGYTLTLQNIDDKVLYFSDRPVRQAGFITTTSFMGNWQYGINSFKSNPPNAAMVHAALKKNVNGMAQAIPIELSEPKVTANGWLFQVKDLQGKMREGSYQDVSVFIDSSLIPANTLF